VPPAAGMVTDARPGSNRSANGAEDCGREEEDAGEFAVEIAGVELPHSLEGAIEVVGELDEVEGGLAGGGVQAGAAAGGQGSAALSPGQSLGILVLSGEDSMTRLGTLIAILVGCVLFFACDAETKSVDSCGDGHLDGDFGEACDGANLGGRDCGDEGFYEGALACTADCRFDTAGCTGRCGDGVIDGLHQEECDNLNMGERTCLGLGFTGGQLSCDSACRLDSSLCETQGPCEALADDPSVQPPGFEGVIRPWGGPGGLCGPDSEYPTCALSEPYPVGSYTLGNSTYAGSVSTRGRWLSIPITGDGASHKFEWIQAKPVGYPYNYQPARPTDFQYVTLTTCPGDFRVTTAYLPADPADPSLVQQCRNQIVAETALHYGPTGFGRCNVPAGETWHLNILWQDPTVLDPTETGCRDTVTGFCETSWKHLPD